MSAISNPIVETSIHLNNQLPQQDPWMDILEIKVREMEAKLKLASNLRSPGKQYKYNSKENLKFHLYLFFIKILFIFMLLFKRKTW